MNRRVQERRIWRDVRECLLEQRRFLGYTQEEAARLARITRAQLANIEKGRQLPSIIQLYRLAHAYRCNPKGLLP